MSPIRWGLAGSRRGEMEESWNSLNYCCFPTGGPQMKHSQLQGKDPLGIGLYSAAQGASGVGGVCLEQVSRMVQETQVGPLGEHGACLYVAEQMDKLQLNEVSIQTERNMKDRKKKPTRAV